MRCSRVIGLFGVPVDATSMEEILALIDRAVHRHRENNTAGYVATLNVDFLANLICSDTERRQCFITALRTADIVTADGVPLLWLSRLMGAPIQHRVDGASLIPCLLEQVNERHGSIFLLGGDRPMTDEAAQEIKKKWPKLHIVGIATPDIDVSPEAPAQSVVDARILTQLHQANPDILLIGLGSPKQELWFQRVRSQIRVPISIGVGGVFKFLANDKPRAPLWMQRSGLEWCYRWFQEPRSLTKRYLRDLLVFPMLVWFAIKQRLAVSRYSAEQGTPVGALNLVTPPLVKIELPKRLSRHSGDGIHNLSEKDFVVLDCSHLESLDAYGAGFLLDFWRRMPRENLYWTGVTPKVRTLLKTFQVDDLVQSSSEHMEQMSTRILDSQKRLKVLLVIDQCNPEGFSVPLVGYQFFDAIRQWADVTLVTSDRHQAKFKVKENVIFIPEGFFGKLCYRSAARVTKSRVAEWNWALRHFFSYPAYWEFDRQVFKRFEKSVRAGEFDIVHAIPPILPRYPVKLCSACKSVPFVLGPVNGGIPFPSGFETIAKREFNGYRLLRKAVRWLPGYLNTYRNATMILFGSQYVLNMMRDRLSLDPSRLSVMSENGVSEHFLCPPLGSSSNDLLRCVYVGRLVPFKQVDVVIQALCGLPEDIADKVSLTIVGQGPAEESLKQLVVQLGLQEKVRFCGWVKQDETRNYYKNADLFCTASIREFGGAVVLEAMACGLPCIVTDYGGIAEYVDAQAAFKIRPVSTGQMIDAFRQHITQLARDPRLRAQMSKAAFERAKQYTWNKKGHDIATLYHSLIKKKRQSHND